MMNKFSRSNFLLAIALFSLILSACTTTRTVQQTTVWDDPLWQNHYRSLSPIKDYELKGRIGITNPQESFSSNFRWQQHSYNHINFRMYGAFGQSYALLKIKPEFSTLDTGDEQHFEGRDPQILLQQVLGWTVPFNYLQDWIKGLPTGVQRDQLLINADGTLQQLNYQNYQVEYHKYSTFDGKKLPKKIKILHTGNKLILSIRDWQFNDKQQTSEL